ncbi:hypothetical protein QE408_002869 [Agrobacterium larrymoorei]|uniref:Uncharacterized protein n=1 Tax=Agrobacterium larrymoorei TaxID=160699 RepID=A0ABU0UL91_9HYPH|nr:hypothetical protein [Agrobacterium larrymoorei]
METAQLIILTQLPLKRSFLNFLMERSSGTACYSIVKRRGVAGRALQEMERKMNSIIYIVGLVVVVGMVLSFVGLA